VVDALKDYELPVGYEYIILGESEETMEALEVLGLAVLLGIVLIYMIMASQFQSLTYPFIIMFTIPLAFTGGFLILFFADMAISVVSAIGLIILTGVVVNNGIVIVDYTNQLIDEGKEIMDALLEAGRTRLRPVIMTALTTILALTTMALGIGEGAEMMQPMAVTSIGGLIYATMLTLVIVPIMYYIITKYTSTVLGILSTVVISGATVAAVMVLGYFWTIYIAVPLVIAIILLIIFLPKKGAEVVE
jgi:HAE1 family hydrophobic/amphiphilic exporter-1